MYHACCSELPNGRVERISRALRFKWAADRSSCEYFPYAHNPLSSILQKKEDVTNVGSKRKAVDEALDGDWGKGEWNESSLPLRKTCPWSPVGVEEILLEDMVQVNTKFHAGRICICMHHVSVCNKECTKVRASFAPF